MVRPVVGGVRAPSLFLKESLISSNIGWKMVTLALPGTDLECPQNVEFPPEIQNSEQAELA